MRLLKTLCLSFLIIMPAAADENTPNFNVLCKYLHKEKPTIGIRSVASADYVAGVDARGGDVVSADVDGSSSGSFLNDPIVIPIQLDLLETAGLDLSVGLFSEAVLGDIKVFGDGRVLLGDVDISDQTKTFCAAQKSRVQSREEHGQKEPDPLPSSDKIEGQYP